MEDPDNLPDSLTALFRRHRLKVTPQRQCIFRILTDNSTHPTADAIYAEARAQMPTISLKTVYETLHSLASLGQLQQLDLGTGATRFDPVVEPHHHLVCESCGKAENVAAGNVAVEMSPAALTTAEHNGFVVRQAEVILHGLCPNCATRSGQQPT